MSNILCIEPNPILAQTYSEALRYAGYQSRHVRSAQDAISAADEHCPDAVLLELELPAYDGIAFLHEFRSYPEWMDIPVILLTNVAPQALRSLQKQLEEDFGVRAYLYKPQANLQKIVRTVQTVA